MFDARRYVAFIGLNPSTADEQVEDPTVRRCINFARQWGYDGMCMLNLFALRTTYPTVLKQADAPVGSHNDAWIRCVVESAARTICAWGNHGSYRGRAQEVLHLLADMPLHCLDMTGQGQPRHPLYIRADTQPFLFQKGESL